MTSLSLVLAGALALIVAGVAYEGWRGGVVVFGVLTFLAGVLLGLGEDTPVVVDVEDGLP